MVLDYGKIGMASPDEVRNNEDVIRAYLVLRTNRTQRTSPRYIKRSSYRGIFSKPLICGLMVGTLYALVAGGFVLFLKPRAFSTSPKGPWCCSRPWSWRGLPSGFPQWLGMEPGLVGNLLAIVVTLALMVAWPG